MSKEIEPVQNVERELTLSEYVHQLPTSHKVVREYGQLKRFARERDSYFKMLEEVINGDLQIPSKEGVFSEHTAHQQIRAMQKRIKELEDDRDSLKRELYKVEHDKKGIES